MTLTNESEKANTITRRTYSVEEAGKILGIGRNAAYEAVKNGNISSVRIGRRVVVPMAAIERMLGGLNAA